METLYAGSGHPPWSGTGIQMLQRLEHRRIGIAHRRRQRHLGERRHPNLRTSVLDNDPRRQCMGGICTRRHSHRRLRRRHWDCRSCLRQHHTFRTDRLQLLCCASAPALRHRWQCMPLPLCQPADRSLRHRSALLRKLRRFSQFPNNMASQLRIWRVPHRHHRAQPLSVTLHAFLRH